MRTFNFSAGPAVLPEAVLHQAAAEMLDWHGSGMSVMEMSHRGKEFISIADKAEADLRTLLAIPANYKVLFLQGGAIAENAIVPMNLLRRPHGGRLRQHRRVVEEVDQGGEEVLRRSTSPRPPRTRRSPTCRRARRGSSRPGAAYVHVCTNETIGGVEYQWTPDTGDVPLVADMSSHILSRVIDVAKYGVIYGGAQKNIGPAGLTLVIVRDDLLDRALPITPSAFHWKEQAAADSMLNTPPTYAIYIAGLVFEWLLAQGGVAAIEQRNIAKANAALRLPRPSAFYRNPVRKQDRSRMNVPFKLRDESLDEAFLKGAKERGMVQLKGHRVGRRHARVDLQRDAGRGRAGARRLHEGLRAAPRLSARDRLRKYQILTLNQISSHGLHRFPAARYTVGKAVERPDAIIVRSHDMHAMAIPASVQGDRPRRRRHQQHSGRGDVETRRAGVQRAGRERQRGQGAGAGRAADGRAQRGAGARATSARLDRAAADLERRSRTARSSSPASSCRTARSASSASARSAASSPTRRSSSA